MRVDDLRGSILLKKEPEENDWERFNPEVDGTGIGSGVKIKGGVNLRVNFNFLEKQKNPFQCIM
jgi:hypothetical protein